MKYGNRWRVRVQLGKMERAKGLPSPSPKPVRLRKNRGSKDYYRRVLERLGLEEGEGSSAGQWGEAGESEDKMSTLRTHPLASARQEASFGVETDLLSCGDSVASRLNSSSVSADLQIQAIKNEIRDFKRQKGELRQLQARLERAPADAALLDAFQVLREQLRIKQRYFDSQLAAMIELVQTNRL
mmetsp:Transcript_12400/g.20833  ORF Transcript_12400/g.20833 Transcript_12400/m.20833 type:complete len:185 (-) Transcript_12400:1-555(-)